MSEVFDGQNGPGSMELFQRVADGVVHGLRRSFFLFGVKGQETEGWITQRVLLEDLLAVGALTLSVGEHYCKCHEFVAV